MVLLLASPLAGYVSGAVVAVDGGAMLDVWHCDRPVPKRPLHFLT